MDTGEDCSCCALLLRVWRQIVRLRLKSTAGTGPPRDLEQRSAATYPANGLLELHFLMLGRMSPAGGSISAVPVDSQETP